MFQENRLREQLAELKLRHRHLDETIEGFKTGDSDMLAMQRLKKEKLQLKDQITRLESMLVPDLTA